MSMSPGTTTWPRASITRRAGRDDRRSTATTRPPATLTSASIPAAPVPSITCPPRIKRSSIAPPRPAIRPSPAPRAPDLFARPAPRPLERDVLVARCRRFRRTHLDELFDLEAVAPQDANPVSVQQVKFDPRIAGPLDPSHPEGRTQKLFAGDTVLGRDAEREQHGVHEEDELASRPQDPR